MRRYRQTIQSEDVNHTERWLVSYADYMTLMFALFVVLYSFAITKEQEFSVLSDSLESIFVKLEPQLQDNSGVTGDGLLLKNSIESEFNLFGNAITNEEQGPELVDGFGDLVNLRKKKLGSPLESLNHDLMTALFDHIEAGEAKVELDQDWLTIELSSGLLFGSGSAVATQNAKKVVKDIYEIVKNVDNYIRIRGFTDDRPINNEQFSSNWQLSVVRATAMLLELERLGMTSAQMAIEGYGEHSPTSSNETEEGRAANRKVVIALSKYALPPKEKKESPQATNQETVIIEDTKVQKANPEIKVIELPHGGIRITTREEELNK